MEQEQQLYIPKKIKVGYNKREDTYTKKLAYIIYYDSKGILRKETSWEGWRNRTITPDEFDNVPTEGFVLNKGVGGQRHSYGWDARNEYIRVYDPRGFEFEISVANLLYILLETTSTKGKGLEGEFVYSWEGKELVLLPVGSGAYKNSTEFTDLQAGKVSAKELIAGAIYRNKTQEDLTYLGRFNWHTFVPKEKYVYHYNDRDRNKNYDGNHNVIKSEKMYVFVDKSGAFLPYKALTHLSKCIDETPISNFAELIEEFNKTMINSSKPISIKGKTRKIKISWDPNNPYNTVKDGQTFIKTSDTEYRSVEIRVDYEYTKGVPVLKGYTLDDNNKKIIIDNGEVMTKSVNTAYSYSDRKSKIYTEDEIHAMDFYNVYAVLENGSEINFKKYNLYF